MLMHYFFYKNNYFDKNDSDMNFILLQRRFDASCIIFKLQVVMKFISLSFLSKLFSQKILIKINYEAFTNFVVIN